MFNHIIKSCQTIATVGCFMLVLALRSSSEPKYKKSSQDAQFGKVAQSVIKRIGASDIQGFEKLVADEGLIVVERRLDYDRTKKEASPIKGPQMPTLKRGEALFSLGGQSGMVREEFEVPFTHSQLNNAKFKRIFLQFQFFVQHQTYDTITSLNTPSNEFPAHYLGPATGGKMGSNYFWYICFVRQGSTWKVWKLEVDYTH